MRAAGAAARRHLATLLDRPVQGVVRERDVAASSGVVVISVDGYGDCVLIGRGGVGEVYRATRLSTGAIVAIKVLHQVSDQSVAWRRTRRELAAMVALAGHAHVIGVIEAYDLPNGPALVMEYAPGGSVGDLLAHRPSPLAVGEALFIAEHAARALVAAHAEGIVHRDIKPHNLLIDGYGQVKLCDFGIASLARSEEFRTQTHAVSLRYASPEDLEGDVDAGPSTDVYSLGATLLHLVHGAPPTLRERLNGWVPPVAHPGDHRVGASGGAVGGASGAAVGVGVSDAVHAGISDVNAGGGAADDGALGDPVHAAISEVSAAVDAVISACLRVDPARRPTAAEVLVMLEQLPLPTGDRPRFIVVAPHRCLVDSPTARVVAADLGELTDDTILRPSRNSRPAVVAVVEETHWSVRVLWKRQLLVAVPLVACLGLVAALLWPLVTRDDAANGSVDVALVDRSTRLVELTLVEWPLGAVGECLVQTADSAALATTGCAAPHDLQRIAVGQVDISSDEPVADDATLVRTVNNNCTGAWEALVADRAIVLPAAVDAAVQLSNGRPTAVAVAAGDNVYQCFVGAPGQRMTGDVLDRSQ